MRLSESPGRTRTSSVPWFDAPGAGADGDGRALGWLRALWRGPRGRCERCLSGRRRWRWHRNCWRGSHGRRCRSRQLRVWCGRRRDDRRRRRARLLALRGLLRRLRDVRARRIEQQRVLAHQPAAGPIGLDDHIDERLEHGAVAGDAHDLAAIGRNYPHLRPLAPRRRPPRRRGKHRERHANRNEDASSRERLVTSISARSVSPSAERTVSRPSPSAAAGEVARLMAARATPLRANRGKRWSSVC